MRNGDADGEQGGEHPAGRAGLVQFLADDRDVSGVAALAADVLGEPDAEQSGRGGPPAEVTGQLAGPFPLVDVRQNLPFGEGAHRLA